MNLFTGLSFGSRHLTARVVVRPRITTLAAATGLSVTSEVLPVVVAGRIVYRAKGRSTQPLTSITSSAGTARIVDATHFEVDLDFDTLTSSDAADGVTAETTALRITANGTYQLRASLGLYIRYFGATTGDVETVFPSPTCTAARSSCLAALPDGALDLGSCGPALLVQACRGSLGVVIDSTSVTSTMTAVDARLASSTFVADTTALVGTARAAALRSELRDHVAASVNDSLGIWLLSPTARQAVLDAAVEPQFDRAYVDPLALVPPSPLAPNDIAKTRQVVADALLEYLLTTDYENSEFGRSYAELTKKFRVQHVESLRTFREVVVPEVIGGKTYYIDRWLGTHTEISVDSSGAVTLVYVEID